MDALGIQSKDGMLHLEIPRAAPKLQSQSEIADRQTCPVEANRVAGAANEEPRLTIRGSRAQQGKISQAEPIYV